MRFVLLCLSIVVFLPGVLVTKSSLAAAASTAAANNLAGSRAGKQRLPLADDLQVAGDDAYIDSEYTEVAVQDAVDDVDNQAGAIKLCKQAGYKVVNGSCGEQGVVEHLCSCHYALTKRNVQ
jgi:predicted metalloprotease